MAEPFPFEDALAAVRGASCDPSPVEETDLASAIGRILAADLRADGPWPSTDRSAMDGFAFAASSGVGEGTELRVVGESLAGHPFGGAVRKGEAVRIMTGAVVPAGADTVVPVEKTSGFEGSAVRLLARVAEGANVRREGSERSRGQLLLAAGTRIGPAEIGALAVLGRTTVPVHRRPLVAIAATGDEVVPVDRVPLPHQLRESNSHALAAKAGACGAETLVLGIAPDEPRGLANVLEEGLRRADLLLTVGGVSAGTRDLVPSVLKALGVEPVFHGVALKPGKPTLFGRSTGPGARFAFGLPGNPLSCLTVFDLLVRPLLLRLGGDRDPLARHRVRLRAEGLRPSARLRAMPARLSLRGEALAEPLPPAPSGDPFALLRADGYALIPAGVEPRNGVEVDFVPCTSASSSRIPAR
ncbi:MAG: hypothetical protein Fur0037_12240 [Planctomycetota bacterium]